MIKIIKKSGKRVTAYRLKDGGDKIKAFIQKGNIAVKEDGTYEIFSQEAVNGRGEIAQPEDYIKVDSAGYPYPNTAEFFEKNHRKIEEDLYEQIPVLMDAWTAEEEMCSEIQFLVERKGLILREDIPEKFFTAPLWGCVLSAAKDAVLVFYSIERDENGNIQDADFNFVERKVFENSYIIVK